MTEAVIVSTARTPIAKAFRGAYNATGGPTLGHVTKFRPAVDLGGFPCNRVREGSDALDGDFTHVSGLHEDGRSARRTDS
jgi:hypothetical protein